MTDKITIGHESTYTHTEVRKMLDGISADARQHGLEIVDNLDGTMGLRAAVPPGYVLVPTNLSMPVRKVLIDRFDRVVKGACLLYDDIWRDLIAAPREE